MLSLRDLTARMHDARDEWVLTVYVDGRVSDSASRDKWHRWLTSTLRARSNALGSEERAAFDAAAELVLAAAPPADHAIGAPGWVAMATASELLHAATILVDVPSLVAWHPRVHVSPYVGAVSRVASAVVVATDTRHAQLWRLGASGELTTLDRVDAEVPSRQVLHMGAAPKPGFHAGTRGTTGVDAAGRRRLVALSHMAAAVAARARDAVRPGDSIVLGGTPHAVRYVRRALSRVTDAPMRAVERLDVDASPSAVTRAALEGATAIREARQHVDVVELLARFADDALAVAGVAHTQRMLDEKCARTLLLTGRLIEHDPDAAESLVRAALDQHAVVEEVTGAAAEQLDREGGGVCAALRFSSSLGTT